VSLVWLIPAALAVAAAVGTALATRTVLAEVAALERAVAGLHPVRDGIRSVAEQVDRTAAATESTLDSLGAGPHR